MTDLERRIRKAAEMLEKKKKERARVRSEYNEASRKLEQANEFKDSMVDADVLQARIDEFSKIANRMKQSQEEYEAAIDDFDELQKIKEERKTKTKIIASTDDQNFWKTSI